MSKSTKPPPKPPVTPRTAASLLLLTPSNRLLLVHRPSNMSFANAHVFPGGVLDPTDPSPRFAALRETFEETGILLTREPPRASPQEIAKAQHAIHDGTLDFQTWLKSINAEPVPDAELVQFSIWTTPERLPKRYRTHFFVTRLPAWVDEHAPVVGDGGREVVSAHFFDILQLPELARRGEIVLFPPQLFLAAALAKAFAAEGWEGVRKEGEGVLGRMDTSPRLGERGGKKVIRVGNGDVVVFEPAAKGGEPRAVLVEYGVDKEAIQEMEAKAKL